MRRIASSLLAFALSAGFALSAQAATLTWTLQDFAFNDGGTAQGSFDYNAATNLFTNINVTTSGGGIAGASYAAPIAFGNASVFDFVPQALADLTGSRNLFVRLSANMTDLGGTILVSIFTIGAGSTEAVCVNEICDAVGVQRRLTGGSITAPIPLPAAGWLLLGGLAGLGALRARRQKTVG